MSALPFETKVGFTALPYAIFSLYMKHPKFNGGVVAVYQYLLARYNANYGYAFPSIDEIAYTLHMSDSTVKRAIRTLQDLRLIKKERSPTHNNNIYLFIAPIEQESEFLSAFPEVVESERKHNETWEKIREGRGEAKERWLGQNKKPAGASGKPSETPSDSLTDEEIHELF